MGYLNNEFNADASTHGFTSPTFTSGEWAHVYKMPLNTDAWKNYASPDQIKNGPAPSTQQDSSKADEWANRINALNKSLAWTNSQNPFNNTGSSNIQSYGGQGITQSGDLTFVPRGSKTVTTTTAGGNDGLFGKIGGLAGAAGIAAGFLGPLAIPIGAGIGGLIDSARG